MQRRGKYAVWVLAMYTVRKPVKWWSLRTVNVSATLAALGMAVSAQPALAHLDIRPTLEVEGEGIDVISSVLQGTSGSDSVWIVRLRPTAAPGAVPIVLRAVYADGRSVEVDQQLTVAPRPETSGFPWVGVVAGVLLAVAFAVLALRLVRRKA